MVILYCYKVHKKFVKFDIKKGTQVDAFFHSTA